VRVRASRLGRGFSAGSSSEPNADCMSGESTWSSIFSSLSESKCSSEISLLSPKRLLRLLPRGRLMYSKVGTDKKA
jgi:hypothetical protein